MGATEALGNLFNKLRPPNNKSRIPSVNGGVASGHGVFEDDDMIVSKPTIIFHTSQIFFNFLAMACFASVASFQAKWKIGPSGLSGFSLFVTVSGIILSTFMLMVPVIYEKYDKLARLARSLKEVRVGFILSGFGTAFSVLIAFIVTISAWTQPGCKNPDKDPHEKLGDDFKRELDGWCNTKKAAAIFMWLTFVSWAGTFVLTFLAWRSGAGSRPRDPPFTHPEVADADDDDDHQPRGGQRDGDEESVYERVEVPPARRPTGDNSHLPSSPFRDNADDGAGRYSYASGGTGYSTPPVAAAAAPRPSMDAYGAFSDPAPTGYGNPTSPTQRVSRTMQYADPYAAVRASIAGGPQQQQQQQSGPPSYDYQGYR